MVLHLLIHESDLLKDLENDFLNIIVLFDNIKSLMLLLIPVFSLDPLDLKDIKGYLTHFNSTELGGIRISCLADKPIFIPGIVILAFHQLILVLVELVVEVEKID